MRMILIWVCCFVFSPAVWATSGDNGATFPVMEQPLPVEQVFQISAQRLDTNKLLVSWQIAPAYYLYRDRFSFRLPSQAAMTVCESEACLAHTLPPGKMIVDAQMGNYTVYEREVSIPVQLPADTRSRQASIVRVTYQGCSAKGFCYPPVSKSIHLDKFNNNTKQADLLISDCEGEACLAPVVIKSDLFSSDQSVWFVLASFLGLGLLLGFTPCVFPMIPILASIIVGHTHRVARVRAFKLALAYVVSSAATYAAAGMLAAWAGGYVQAFFQEPWVLVGASIALVLLAFSLFGFYELQLPAVLRHHLSAHSQKQRGGTYFGVIVMGCLATLIISPCVSAPLVAALGYISTTGDMYLGGGALFLLGLGMSLPLLIILTVGSRYLPKAGRWMQAIRNICGALLLVVAVSLLIRVFPASMNWFFPSFQAQSDLVFKSIKNTADLDSALLEAKREGKAVLVDFYADWCITCQKLEKHTLNNPIVVPVLKKMVLLRADVTANHADDKALQRRLNVYAPPTIVLFDSDGNELVNQRIVGDIGPEEFLKKLPSRK